MARTRQQELRIRQRRLEQAGTLERVELVKVECDRCGSTVYADADGGPRAHLRDTRPGEELFSSIVPTMTSCEP